MRRAAADALLSCGIAFPVVAIGSRRQKSLSESGKGVQYVTAQRALESHVSARIKIEMNDG